MLYRRVAQCLVTSCIRLTIWIWAQGDHDPMKNGELIVNVSGSPSLGPTSQVRRVCGEGWIGIVVVGQTRTE